MLALSRHCRTHCRYSTTVPRGATETTTTMHPDRVQLGLAKRNGALPPAQATIVAPKHRQLMAAMPDVGHLLSWVICFAGHLTAETLPHHRHTSRPNDTAMVTPPINATPEVPTHTGAAIRRRTMRTPTGSLNETRSATIIDAQASDSPTHEVVQPLWRTCTIPAPRDNEGHRQGV